MALWLQSASLRRRILPCHPQVGGNTNFAIAAARLGLRCACLGHTGADYAGEFLADVLSQEGVQLQQLLGECRAFRPPPLRAAHSHGASLRAARTLRLFRNGEGQFSRRVFSCQRRRAMRSLCAA